MSRRYDSDWLGITVVVVLAVALIIGLAIVVSNTTPRSSEGVTKIAEDTARLPMGEEMILKRSKGKAGSDVWHITYDGEGTVTMRTDTLFGEDKRKIKLCGVGCVANVDLGWLVTTPTFTLNADNTVNVTWPAGFLSGWTFWEAD